MGGATIPIVSTVAGGLFGMYGADKQADAMADAQAQAAATSGQSAALQQQMGEKGLLAQLYLAQMAMQQAQQGQQLELEREARALQAVEPFRRLGYGAIPSLVGLYQDTLSTPLQAQVPPELQAMFDLQKQDAQRQLNRQLAQQGTLGSPIGAATSADAFRRLTTEQALQGYQTGLARAQMEDARKWGRAMELTNMGANLGTAGYQSGAGQTGQMANIYSGLGSGLAGTYGNIGQGLGSTYGNLTSSYSQMAPTMGTAAGSSYANWANQLNSLAGMYMNNPAAFGVTRRSPTV